MHAKWAFSWLAPRLALVALGVTAFLSYRAGGDLLQAVIRGILAAIAVLWLQRVFLGWLQHGIEQRPASAAPEPSGDEPRSENAGR